MNYKFPYISNISQVLPAIKDRKEFIVADKEGGYTIINYVVAMEDTFPPVKSEADAILRECRGLVFSTKSGEVMSRRYHKFFNVGEREETSPQFVDLSKPHVILEKLDGSMITPLIADGKLRWATKMGITDTALQVEEFIKQGGLINYEEFANYCLTCGFTPIFEWCSRKQKIVVDYPKDELILTAVRDNRDGSYFNHSMLCDYFGKNFNIPVVQAYDPAPAIGEKYDIHYMKEKIAEWSDAEGVVVRFNDGHMVKIKGEWYLQLHRAKDVTKFEKNVLEIILEDKLDDLLPLVEPDYQEMLKKYRDDVFWGLTGVAETLERTYDNILENMFSGTKREFAVHWVKKIENKNYHSFMFSMWEGKDAFELLKAELLKSCSSINRLENCRWMMNGAKYEITERAKVEADEV